jgi:WD40 repeat protein
VAFAADGKTLVTCGTDRTARLWSVDEQLSDNLSPSHPSIGHPVQVVRVSLSGDGQHLATALWDGMVCLWRLPEGPPTAYSVPGGWITLPALSPDGRLVLPRGTSYRDGTLLETRVYEADSGKQAGPKLDPGGIVLDAAFSPDGTKVAISSSTARTNAERRQDDRLFEPNGKAGNVQIWDWKAGKLLAGPIPTPGEPRGLAFRPDGRTLAVVCADYRVLLIDPGRGTITHTLDSGIRTHPWHPNQWWSNGEARFSSDGRFLVTWEMSPHVHVWDPDRGRLLHTLPHPQRVRHVSFHPTTPTLLATSGWDNIVRIWDLATGKLLIQLEHPREVIRLRFSPDGSRLLTGCDDGRLRVWDWKAGKLEDGLPPHPSVLQDFGLTADRRWLVTLGMGELRVTDWRTKTPVGPLWDLKSGLKLSLDIPTGDRRVIVGGFGGSLEAYDLKRMLTPAAEPAEDLVRLAELAAGRRILGNGNVMPLSSSEWAERWRLHRTHYPQATDRKP